MPDVLLRQKDGIDHMDDSVAAVDSSLGHQGSINLHGAAIVADGQRMTVQRIGGFHAGTSFAVIFPGAT